MTDGFPSRCCHRPRHRKDAEFAVPTDACAHKRSRHGIAYVIVASRALDVDAIPRVISTLRQYERRRAWMQQGTSAVVRERWNRCSARRRWPPSSRAGWARSTSPRRAQTKPDDQRARRGAQPHDAWVPKVGRNTRQARLGLDAVHAFAGFARFGHGGDLGVNVSKLEIRPSDIPGRC